MTATSDAFKGIVPPRSTAAPRFDRFSNTSDQATVIRSTTPVHSAFSTSVRPWRYTGCFECNNQSNMERSYS